MKYYYTNTQNQTTGPVEVSELVGFRTAGILRDANFVVAEGAQQWVTLGSILNPPGAPVPTSPTVPNVAPKLEHAQTGVPAQKGPPVKPTIICLGISWVLLLLPIMGTSFIAFPLAGAALILSIIIMAKGDTKNGVILLVATVVGTPIIYGLSWLLVAVGLGALFSHH
jgi:hypothetical protein